METPVDTFEGMEQITRKPDDSALILATADIAVSRQREMKLAVNDSVWESLSNVGQMNFSDFPPVKHCTELTVGRKYPIVAIRRAKEDCVSEIL